VGGISLASSDFHGGGGSGSSGGGLGGIPAHGGKGEGGPAQLEPTGERRDHAAELLTGEAETRRRWLEMRWR
jgi:hypothetical protein